MLIRIQTHEFPGNKALIRGTVSRFHVGKALRGLWPQAIESRKLLAQSGGDNDEARMLIATGYMAHEEAGCCARGPSRVATARRVRRAEILSFVCEWLDPWRGRCRRRPVGLGEQFNH